MVNFMWCNLSQFLKSHGNNTYIFTSHTKKKRYCSVKGFMVLTRLGHPDLKGAALSHTCVSSPVCFTWRNLPPSLGLNSKATGLVAALLSPGLTRG